MNVKVKDIMVASPVTTHKHVSIGHIKDIMKKNKIHSVPIINNDKELEGILTNNDLTGDISDETQARLVMTKKVLTVPQYSKVHIAARIMRNHHIHHLVVTHEKKIVGVVSSFDLLALIEDHRYVAKNAPTKSKKESNF